MIIVHDIFICKPGNASKMAKMFKKSMGDHPQTVNIMTDVTGQFHKVVMVTRYESLAEYEKALEAYMHPDEQMKQEMDEMRDIQEMYLTGSREIYKTW